MTNEPQIACIPPELIGAMWPHVVPCLVRGLTAAPDLSLLRIAHELEKGTAQLWAVLETPHVLAAWLTATYEANDGATFLGVYGLGGAGLERWGQRLGELMVDVARSYQCASVRFMGREAWGRVLPSYRVIGRQGTETIFERAVA